MEDDIGAGKVGPSTEEWRGVGKEQEEPTQAVDKERPRSKQKEGRNVMEVKRRKCFKEERVAAVLSMADRSRKIVADKCPVDYASCRSLVI